ncbi:hypothetical protein B9Z55_021398 [Caenorhabditis nigoni]|uniref:SXP/RAL-2 family protein Ani s 5-like cation-binding domain-containing protein n=1 Tax=Caenorhabditis nigoni TaxID=1611254 RepID=A0A2G5TRY1_9PELO|nr:hypothetical protein B9Z55_021398 [Caenorhabditis nigoni]
MFKSFILISVVTSALFAAPVPEKTRKFLNRTNRHTDRDFIKYLKLRAELLSFGISPQAADGLIRIGKTFEQSVVKPDGSTPNPLEAVDAVLKLVEDIDTFMKTQSPEDQAAYKRMSEANKAKSDAKNGGKIFEFQLI